MDRLIGDRVILDRARDHRLAFAFVFNLDQVRDELAGAERLAEFGRFQLDRDRAAGAAIKDAWDEAVPTGGACAAGRGPVALLNAQYNARHRRALPGF